MQTWRAGPETVRFDTARGRLIRGEERVKARRRWSSWGTLSLCLGEPLALPPAGDPQGFRVLAWGEEPVWVIRLSGTNTCGASGTVELSASEDDVELAALLIDGLPWSEGGRQRGRELFLAALRATVLERWDAASERDRSEILLHLQNDPDPEAEAILRALAERGDHRLRDVEAALANRPEQGPARAR